MRRIWLVVGAMLVGAVVLPLYVTWSDDTEPTAVSVLSETRALALTTTSTQQRPDAEPSESSIASSTTVARTLEDARRMFLLEMADAFGAREIESVQCDPPLTSVLVGSFASCEVGDSPPILIDVFLTERPQFEWQYIGVIESEPASEPGQLAYLAPDPVAIGQSVSAMFDYYLGRKPTQSELTEFVDYFLELDRLSYDAYLSGEYWDVPARFIDHFMDRYGETIAKKENRELAREAFLRWEEDLHRLSPPASAEDLGRLNPP